MKIKEPATGDYEILVQETRSYLLREDDHDETKLPKWVQDRLRQLRQDQENLNKELARTKEAHAILFEREGWFTIPGPPENAVKDNVYRLFYLSGSGAHPACTLSPGDIVLVGRSKHD